MNEARLAELIERYFERALSPGEKSEFEAMLLAHAEARVRFWETTEWHALFRQWGEQEIGRQAAIDDQPLAPAPKPRPLVRAATPRPRVLPFPPRRRGLPLGRVLAWAAVLALSAVGAWIWQARQPLARIGETVEAEWSGPAWPRGAVLRRDAVTLARGAVQLDFVNGARLVLQGPAELEITGPKAVRLRRGHLTAEIPKPAHGFTVQTPTSTAVDLGTRFGVAVEDDGASETHVFAGKVAVAAGSEKLTLEKGAAAIASAGSLRRGLADARKFPPLVLVREPRHDWRFTGPAGAPAPDGTQIPDRNGGATAVVRGAGAVFAATAGGIKLPGGSSQTQASIVLPPGVATGTFGGSGRFQSVTYECWATPAARVQWARLFEFNARAAGETPALDGENQEDNFLHFAMDAPGTLAPLLRRQRPGAKVAVEFERASLLNRRTHYLVAYDAPQRRWAGYQDGVLAASMADPDGVATLNDVNNRLGGGNFRFVWAGTMHDFRIYDYALTPEQVRVRFQSSSAAP